MQHGPNKIALVCDWFLPRIGGVELHIRDLARQLIKQGHEVHVITSSPGPDLVDGIRVHRLKLRLFKPLGISSDPRTVPLLENLISREKYDLVHAHGLASSLSHLSIRVSNKQNRGSVMTSHSMIPEIPFEKGFAFFIPFLVRLAALPVFRRFIRLRSLWPTVLTAVSSTVAIDMARIYRKNDIHVLHNAVDPQEWQSNIQRSQAPLRVTSVMRLTNFKRALELINMIPEINAKLPTDRQPIFTIIGTGPLKEPMLQRIRELGIEQQVELLGYIPRHKIKEVFEQSTLFVLPSRKEGFGIAALEARCFGLPIVAMNHGGVRDIVTHGHDGYLANDDDEFVEYIAGLMQDAATRNELATAAASPIHAFTWEDILPRYLSMYEEALRDSPSHFFGQELSYAAVLDRRYGT